MAGPWNRGEQWQVLTPSEENTPLDGGDGTASVELSGDEEAVVGLFAARGASDPSRDPVTGADLGVLQQEPKK
jgi:Mn-containing catalase